MASATKTANGKWRARWRDDQGRTQGRSGFGLKTDALRYAKGQEHSVAAGTYVDPTAGKVTFETYAQEWRARQVHSPGTACQVEGNLRNHVFPILGKRPLSAIKPSEVQALVKRMSQTPLAPATVEVIYRYVVAIFRAAVADRLIPSSPCVGIKLPKQEPSKVIPLAVEAVEALVDAMPPRYEAMVFVAAGTGLRQGECFGLAVDRVDFFRKTVRVDQQVVVHPGSPLHLARLKTDASYRTIPVAPVVVAALSAHLAAFSAGPDA